MPIDIMSPVQALERAAITYKGFKESEKHLAIAQKNSDIAQQNANTKEKVANAKIKDMEERTAIEKQKADAKTKTAEAKQTEANAKQTRADKMLTPEQQLQKSKDDKSIHLADARKAKQVTELQKTLQNMQYNPNNPEKRNYSQQYLAITQDGIRNNQGKGSE